VSKWQKLAQMLNETETNTKPAPMAYPSLESSSRPNAMEKFYAQSRPIVQNPLVSKDPANLTPA